ncbi:MAG: hypothetical protein ACTHMS_02855 [Jatrophihabitans sp.]|uniref:hypothetical protein n=1 Tax=Jatrophihabitans sp. TaxID=1932789 RepID=UPI003F7D40E9
MSDRYDDRDDPARLSRRHGLWGLAVLVMAAIIVVTFVVLFTGSHEGGSQDYTGTDDSTIAGAQPGVSSPAVSTPSSAPSSAPSRPKPPPVVGGPAVAGLARQINQLRTSAGLQPVTAQSSQDATACAAAGGNGPTCVPHYMYAQVPDQDPVTAFKSLESVNKSWLLDANTLRMEIGFAKLPSGNYNCAVLKFP